MADPDFVLPYDIHRGMLLNEDPTANRMRIPAAPAFIPSSKPRVRICHQCGFVLPQDFPWIVCDDCQLLPQLKTQNAPSPAHALPANKDATTPGQAVSFCVFVTYTQGVLAAGLLYYVESLASR